MAKKQFKAESKRLLDMMVNSIYTHKEIFLRELISNASDAIDKLYYRALKDDDTGCNRDDFFIRIEPNKETRTLVITDNGCGMTKDELDKNLGIIANSGSFNFKKENEKQEDIDIIGQFGVGFYSAFMVSDHVTVESRAAGSDEAWCWESTGADGYTINSCQKDSNGTVITLHIKENTDEDNYDEYLDQYRLRSIVKKYSDYIRYPIRMQMEKSKLKEGSKDEYETYMEDETLNSMVPLWKKNKNEVTDEEYNGFYKEKFMDWQDPARIIRTHAEGAATYDALLFIPAKAPMDFYTREYEKGLQLYSNGVMIMEKCADLLPDHFSFVKGLVDSQDLSLNISREMLQHDRQLKLIATRLEKKIKSELESMLKNDREKYEEFFKSFGLQLKYGLYADYGMHKDELKDLVLFHSSGENKMVTLKEYVNNMKDDQTSIYYACGDSVEHIERLPQTELLLDKGFEILYLTDNIDEFALKMLDKYNEKDFKNIASDDLGIETEEEKKDAEKQVEENKDMLEFMRDSLNGKVKAVILSQRLKSHPVCISTKGAITMEMEKVLNAMPATDKVTAERVLEINSNHPIFKKLTNLYSEDKDTLKEYADLLYTQAMLIEGFPVDDPVKFSNEICRLMAD